MVTTLGVVEVSAPLAAAAESAAMRGLARRRFGGKSLLEWVVRRASEATRLDQLVVLAGDDPHGRSLVQSAPPDACVFLAPAADALGRLAQAVRKFPCRGVVRLSVASPFVDPVLVDRLIAAAGDSACDYASYCLSDGRPVVQSKLGVFAEWCRGTAVLQADQHATDPRERTDSTRFLWSHPELFALRLLAAPAPLDRDDLRLAIQDEEDWEHVQLILDALGPESLDWQFIANLLDRQPELRERMAVRNRAEADVS